LPLLSTFIIPLWPCFPNLLSHFAPAFHIYYHTLTLLSKFIIPLCPCFPHLLSHFAPAFHIYYPTLTLFSKFLSHFVSIFHIYYPTLPLLSTFIIPLLPCFQNLLSHFVPAFHIYYPTLPLISAFIIPLWPCFPNLLSNFAFAFQLYYPMWLKFCMKQLPIMLLSIFEFRQNRCSELMKTTVTEFALCWYSSTVGSLLIQTAQCALWWYRQHRALSVDTDSTVRSLLIQTAPCAPTRAGTPPFLTRFSLFSLMTPNNAEFLNFCSVSAEVSAEVLVVLRYYSASLLHCFRMLQYSVIPKRRAPIIQWRDVAFQKNG
jgi:hypothetical protein